MKTKIYAVFHRAICVILLSVNLAHLTTKYLAYDTSVDVGFDTPVTLTLPNLSLCFDLNTILGEHEILIFSSHSPHYVGLTSKEIFDRVPRVDQVVSKCSLRDPWTDRIVDVDNSSECSKLFAIKRYRMHCFMCYLFHPMERYNFSFNALAFSLNEPKLLFKLTIDGPLSKGHTVAPLIHLDELADVDRIYMKELYPSKVNNELYHLEYELYEIKRLPSPYSTRCGPEPLLRCQYNCYGRKYAEFGLTPAAGVVKEAAEDVFLKVVNYTGHGEETKIWTKTDEECNKVCTSEQCRQNQVITYISGPFESRSKLAFNVGTYRGPINLIRHSPNFLLVDFVTNCFSLAGIWISFSIASFLFPAKRFDLVTAYTACTLLRTQLYYQFNSKVTIESVNEKKGTSKKIKFVHRFISTAVKLVTLVIFIIQASNLCLIYFKYETILKYHHALNPEFEYRLPSTSICLDIVDILSTGRRGAITEDNYEEVLTQGNNWINSTMEQIFNKTIGEDFLINCRVKNYHWLESFKGIFKLKSREECLRKEFNLRKFYSRWQMCYLFTPEKLPKNLNYKLDQSHLAFTELNPSILYSLVLNPVIKNFRKIDFIVYFDGYAPYISSEYRAFSPSLGGKRAVILTFHTLVYEYLPPPYDTQCDPVLNTAMCRNRCRESGLSKLNRVPYVNLVEHSSEKRLLSFNDLKNSTVHELYWQLEEKCEKKCRRYHCFGNFTLTYSRHVTGRVYYDLEVIVSLEAVPRIHYKSVPSFELYDLYFQIFCLLAFWLGFSFVGLDFVQRKRDKRFNAAAKVLYAESIKLLLTLSRITSSMNVQLGKGSNLERNLLIKRVICHSICVLGMLFHVILPIAEYLSYPTKQLTKITREDPLPFELIVCSEAQELFERGYLFGQRGPKAEYLFDRKLDEILSEAKKLTNLLYACGYWGLSGDEDKTNEMNKATDQVFFESSNSSICDKLFSTRIYLGQGNICFVYKPNRKLMWNRSKMLASINAAKTALSVSLNSSVISHRFTVIAHQDRNIKALPLHTSVWAPPVHKKTGNNRYVVSYTSYYIKLLPHPYSDQGFVLAHITYCFRKCTNEIMSRFNFTRIGFGFKFKVNKQLFNSHRNNTHFSKFVAQIDQLCDRKCLVDDTFRFRHNIYMVTMISEPLPNEGGQRESTRFDLRRTDDPIIKVRLFVAIPLYDLIINIGSVISIWYGLSVINIPDLATEKDFEKIYIRTTEHLNRTKCILDRMSADRSAIESGQSETGYKLN